MAVSFVGFAPPGTSGSATLTSFPTALPAGWAAGDVAVLVAHLSGSALTISTPAGWALLAGPTWPAQEGSASRAYAWSRVLQAGDTAPTLTNSGSVTGGWSCTAYRGASGVVQAAVATASSTSVTLPTLPGVGAGSALAVGVHCRVTSGTIPTNLTHDGAYLEVVDTATSRATSNANVRLGSAYRLVGSAGSYGGEQVASDVTGSMIAVLVELGAASSDSTTAPDGISVPAAVGDPAASWSTTSDPDGITVPAELGAPAASWATESVPVGVQVAVALGDPSAAWSGGAGPDGLAVPVAVGGPGAVWSVDASPTGVVVPVDLGDPAAGWSVEAVPDGVEVPVAVGAPAVSTPGQRVVRPYSGTVARPGPGVVARPSAGVVVRP
ncbi:hypothetical protein [Micromonospora carbonacea]|uniref:Uncharacterized protein n=1 Tax=Micromonospora carbonacea TaxID=47853 RepID=A0A1C5A2T5_9ACTN|nr:hypothetical protein [Micromonospora carbonacea]SCF39459.1 hypothetical protein GA0070563_11124 [Micromonospora carbonacea]